MQIGSFIHVAVCVFRSRDSLYIHNAGCEFRYVTGKGTGVYAKQKLQTRKNSDAMQKQEKLSALSQKRLFLIVQQIHPSSFFPHQSSQGKSASSTLVQVKYPSPAGPKAVKSNSKKFLMTGLTASLARFFTSSTRLSNLLKLSLEYSVPLLASLEVLRKRFSSSWGRYSAEELEPMRRYILPVLKGPLGGGLAGGGGRRWEAT